MSSHVLSLGGSAADTLAKESAAAVKDAMMCGTSQNVLDLARRAHERAASARAGHDQRGQPAGRYRVKGEKNGSQLVELP